MQKQKEMEDRYSWTSATNTKCPEWAMMAELENQYGVTMLQIEKFNKKREKRQRKNNKNKISDWLL